MGMYLQLVALRITSMQKAHVCKNINHKTYP